MYILATFTDVYTYIYVLPDYYTFDLIFQLPTIEKSNQNAFLTKYNLEYFDLIY